MTMIMIIIADSVITRIITTTINEKIKKEFPLLKLAESLKIKFHNSLIMMQFFIVVIIVVLKLIIIRVSMLIYFIINCIISFINYIKDIEINFGSIIANFTFIVMDYNIKIEIAFIVRALEMIVISFRKAYDFVLKAQNLINHLNRITK